MNISNDLPYRGLATPSAPPSATRLSSTSRLLIGALIGAVMVALSGCTKIIEPEETFTAEVVVDASMSSLTSEAFKVAESEIAEVLSTMPLPAEVTVTAFNHRPGTTCQPLRIQAVPQNNEEQNKQLRAQLVAGLPAALSSYITCLSDDATGASGGGSEVFGAVHRALATSKADTLTIFTDGCEVSRLGRTCLGPRQMLSPTFVDDTLEALPAQLLTLPAQSVVLPEVTLVGLGVGSNLDQESLVALTDLWVTFMSRLGVQAVTR